MQQILPSNGPRASLDRDGDADESRPQSSLLPATDGHIRQQKQSFWLRRTVFIAFSFLFIACALALIGVSRHITAQNGLPLSLSSSSYSWTYGPTGVLVLILALWRQVDYNCRSMQPWWEMAHGPSTAARSVLLDYVSPFQPMVCISAFKNGHYTVLISTLAFFILKLIILLSTTLFVVEPTWHLESVFSRYQNTFSTEHMWNLPGDTITGKWANIREHSRMGDVSIWSYMATLNNATSNSPGGANSGTMLYQSLSTVESSSNISSISATVNVFMPSITCEAASLSLPTTTFTAQQSYLNYKFNSPSCSSGDLEAMNLDCEPDCMNLKRSYSLHQVNCEKNNTLVNKRSSNSSEPDVYYAIAVADLSTAISDDHYRQYNRVSIRSASATICKVSYGMAWANATWDTFSERGTLDKDPVLGDNLRHLPNMTNHDLAEILMANLHAASDTVLVDPSITASIIGGFPQYAFSFFQLLAAQVKSRENEVDALLQPSILCELSKAVFEGISIAFAKKALLVEDLDGEPFEAVAHISENRLHIRHYTLWPMVSAFFLLSVFCVILSFIVPIGGDQVTFMGSIASHASVIVKSPSLLVALKNTGHFRNSQLKTQLENMHFTANVSRHGLQVEAFGSTRETPPDGQRSKPPWLPISVKLPMVVLSFSLPLLVIILLEVLQHLSDRRHGLLDLDSSSSATLSYAIRLASTLLAFLIATLFNNLDFGIAVFTPFSSLRLGSAPAQRSVLFHLLGVSPFLILLDTFRRRQFGSAASNLSTLLGSFLTIAVSGLWVMGDPIQTSSVATVMVQDWDKGWLTNYNDDQGASLALNIVRHEGANTTSTIQGYDVLAKVSVESTTLLNRANNTYETRVLRPVLDCHFVPQEEIIVTSAIRQMATGKASWQEVADILIALNKTVSSGCSQSTSERKDTGALVVHQNVTGVPTSQLFEDVWVGQYLDLEVTPGRSKEVCPSTAILFGKLGGIEGNGPRTDNNLTALFCSQQIEEIPATVTYKGNPSNGELVGFQLHTERSKSWTNGTTNSTNLAFKLKEFFDSGLTKFPVPWETLGRDGDYYDVFFNHIIYGPEGASAADIVGPHNTDALTGVITRSFKEYFAHVIDLNFRSKHSETSTQGTALQTTTRLAVHNVSKIILQALLAATTVLSFVGYSLVKIRGTLPRNPCSIASTMGFLADSQLCDPKTGILPKDASLMTERELRQSLHGFVFSMGWWERSKHNNSSRRASTSGEESDDLDAGDQQEASESTYFGIDVGHTNALGFSKKEK